MVFANNSQISIKEHEHPVKTILDKDSAFVKIYNCLCQHTINLFVCRFLDRAKTIISQVVLDF